MYFYPSRSFVPSYFHTSISSAAYKQILYLVDIIYPLARAVNIFTRDLSKYRLKLYTTGGLCNNFLIAIKVFKSVYLVLF